MSTLRPFNIKIKTTSKYEGKERKKENRIMTNSAYDAHSLSLIKGLGWLTVKELIRFETATTVFKSVNQLFSNLWTTP